MDDLYALTYALISPELEIVGITSAHFNNTQLLTDSMWHIYPTKNINTLKISQDLNEEILRLMDTLEIPHPKGCNRMVGYAWGFYEGAPVPESPAVDFIIEQALWVPDGQKLTVIVLGASTNLAAAILKNPDIVPKLSCHLLATKYDIRRNAWDKNSFNVRNDLNAFDIIMNTPGLEVYIIPGNVSRKLVFERQKTLDLLNDSAGIEQLLRRRWDEVSAGKTWIMWDLALIQAIVHPELAVVEDCPAPPENTKEEVKVYTSINYESMQELFWKRMKKFKKEE